MIRFIIGALPILIGYALCGMILFGSYTNLFRGFSNSVVTLFSAANGDNVHDTFDGIYGQNTVIALFSRIYMISFIAIFTYSVINIFILIMEDAYFTVKEGGITDALKRDFKDTLDTVFDNRLDHAREEDKRRREQALAILKEKDKKTPKTPTRGRSNSSAESRSFSDNRAAPRRPSETLLSQSFRSLNTRHVPDDDEDSSGSITEFPISQSVESEIRFFQQLREKAPERSATQDDMSRLLTLLEKVKRGNMLSIGHNKSEIAELSSALLKQLQ